ncbi:M91 family zinc metallopeptidase, partial [Sphingobacterium hotanense]|uniref:M91 family zinc metallopeptidase n=1 Tax=Sphingobacterium hotanense TaxID=649196 RepID=UPI0021A50D30
ENQAELGDQLDYGARFYDAEIARFNVIDRFAEKYYSMTPYQYGGLDPIKHIDINGDSLYVTHRTGFLGLGGKQTLRYEGGNLYNKDGSAYTGRVKGFLGKAVNALRAMSSTSEGGAMVSELESSSNHFTIVKSSGSRFVRDPGGTMQAFANQLRTDPAQTHVFQSLQSQGVNLSGGTGGIIEWNPSGVMLPTLNGAMRNGTVELGHEMFHALDANRGLLDDRVEQGVKRDEWQAVYRENMLRSQMRLPLRTHYIKNVNSDGSFIGGTGPRLLTPANRPLLPNWYTP